MALSLLNMISIPQDKPGPDLEYRLAWVLTYNEDINSTETIRQVVDQAREYHLNGLLPIAHRCGRAYYASSLVPIYNPTDADPPLDTLAAFIRFAHDTSGGKPYIEIHPWVVLFPVWLEAVSPPQGHVVLTHPEWLTPKYQAGPEAPGEIDQQWLDPGVPGVCDHLVQICREIVARYDVDGLNLDYIRYYEGGHGYNPIALDRFRRRTKRTDIPTPEDAGWQAWQREQITNLVRRIYVETKMIKPGLKLSVCSIVGAGPEKPYEKQDYYTRVMQDWPSWFKEGIADINLPMNYNSEQKPHEELLKLLRNKAFPNIAQVPKTPLLEKPDTGIIRGFVYRGDKAGVLDGMKMTLSAAGKQVFTDGSGYYAFVRVPPGLHEIRVSKDSETFKTRKVSVKPGEIVTVNFDLLGLVEHRL